MSLRKRQFRIYRGWWVVAAAFLADMAVVGATGYGLSVLMQPMEGALKWSRSEIVGAITLSRIVAGVASPALGHVIDRYGSRTLMTISALVFGACVMALGSVQTLWQYYLLVGLGFGLTSPGLLSLGPRAAVVNWFVRKRSLAITIFTLGGSAAGIVLAPVVAWTEAQVNWKVAWMVIGAVSWTVIPMAWAFVRRRPEDVGLLPDGDKPGSASTSKPSTQGKPAPVREEAPWTVRESLHTRSLWLAIVGLALIGMPAGTMFIHMAPYITSKGFLPAEGVAALSIYASGGIAGRFIWGALIDRYGVHTMLVSHGCFYGLSLIAFLLPTSLAGLYLGAFMLGLSIGGVHQLSSQTMPAYFGRKIVGTLYGYSAPFTTLVGAVAPLFAALMYDINRSYTIPFSVFAIACFLAGTLFLLAPPPVHPRQRLATATPR